MIDYLVSHQALIREYINGVAFVLLSTLSLMITIFLFDTWMEKRPKDLREWGQISGVKTACALWWVFSSESYRTFNVWVSYTSGRKVLHLSDSLDVSLGVGVFGTASMSSILGYLAAGMIFCAALMRSITIFTPPDWTRVWLYALVMAAIFIILPDVVR